jgi:hypothetical protein
MPLSEADSRTVLLHLEVIRNIIRGGKPVPGDIRDVAASFEPPRVVKSAPCRYCSGTGVDPNTMLLSHPPKPAPCNHCRGTGKADGSVEAYVDPDLDGGAAREAAETASRTLKPYSSPEPRR